MRTLQNILKRLGWPVDQMSFKQIARELHRRWFQNPPDGMHAEQAIGAASATGIVVALASEGNLNALCWTDNPVASRDAPVPLEEKKIFLRDSTESIPPPEERRSAHRRPGKEIVCWSGSDDNIGDGFLVDYSAGGIALITEKERSPQIGAELFASIRNRSGKTEDLGPATVIRSETLTPDLSLTCLRLHMPRPDLLQS